MKLRIFALIALGLLALTGCSKPEETVIDQKAAKSQPGADTPAATTTGVSSESQIRSEKEGK